MEGTTVRGGLGWRQSTLVDTIVETPRVKSLVLDVPNSLAHRAGQHVDVRLTAEDGYQAARSYSIASPPEERRLVLTIERLDDGEVSPYLVDELRVGDPLELRGPIGGYFVWESSMSGPLLLIAGGSGIVPLRAIIRHRIATNSDAPVRLVYSVRTPDDVIYRQEMDRLATSATGIEVIYTFTRVAPGGWAGYQRRIDAALLAEVCWPPESKPTAFICGPTPLVETAANILSTLGYQPTSIKTERFGPTGGP
ncbi:MAG: oxidoreductase FAD/NAD(P)-binding domain protein [Chloroflexi bacterium]|nr:oxidoreductase FAD/NAD(P)-binding domain protein [Chloroflexota bacterium]